MTESRSLTASVFSVVEPEIFWSTVSGTMVGFLRCEPSFPTRGESELADGDGFSELERGGLCKELRSPATRKVDLNETAGVRRPELDAIDEIECEGECFA